MSEKEVNAFAKGFKEGWDKGVFCELSVLKQLMYDINDKKRIEERIKELKEGEDGSLMNELVRRKKK
jgi:hypothetical protein